MPKFNLDINGVGAGAAEGREAYSGEIPKTGTYEGILKVITIGTIGAQAQNAGKSKLSVGVELTNTPNGAYDGFLAWGNLNLIDSSIPFVNQFLWCLTNGSDAEKTAIEKAFYGGGIVVDERKKHVLKIGKYKIESPEGTTPIRVSISNRAFFNEATKQTTQTVRIESYLPAGGTKSSGGGQEIEEAPEEETYDDDDVVEYADDDDAALLDVE